jgi:hypothetical protein
MSVAEKLCFVIKIGAIYLRTGDEVTSVDFLNLVIKRDYVRLSRHALNLRYEI